MIRQAAFIADNRPLKGALHCHTTRSDGKGDPGEVMRMHKEHGYDFIALTDHRFYNYANFAPETGLTVIPGMEMDGNIQPSNGGVHCFHTVSIGPSVDDGNGFAQDQRFESARPADQYAYQSTVDMLRAANNMVIYCHPEWSNTPSHEFWDLKGCFAMELWNSGCVIEDDQDTDNGWVWDQVLLHGNRMWGVAADDGHAMYQHCNGWVMVNAKNDINSILRALRDGAFYASAGPEIRDFRIEDGRAIVECSPACRVTLRNGIRPVHVAESEPGETITTAAFDLKDNYPFIRAVVTDQEGRKAWTNPIFLRG